MLQIVTHPDKRLRDKSQPVDFITDDVKTFCHGLIDTMYNGGGVGIAAIQVGVPLNIFIMEAPLVMVGSVDSPVHNYVARMEPGSQTKVIPVVFINPVIMEVSSETTVEAEGCLSFPGVLVNIERPKTSVVKATSLEGKDFIVTGHGLYSRAMLHEMDHLGGKIFLDLLGSTKRAMVLKKYKEANGI